MASHVITHSALLPHPCGGLTKSKSLNLIEAGLITRPLKNGRINIWPISEIEILDRAVIVGKSDEEIKEIVALLELERTSSDPISHPKITQLRAMVVAAKARATEPDVSMITQVNGRV